MNLIELINGWVKGEGLWGGWVVGSSVGPVEGRVQGLRERWMGVGGRVKGEGLI